jgi:hypothetical protein
MSQMSSLFLCLLLVLSDLVSSGASAAVPDASLHCVTVDGAPPLPGKCTVRRLLHFRVFRVCAPFASVGRVFIADRYAWASQGPMDRALMRYKLPNANCSRGQVRTLT